jgi:integrase
MEKSGKNVLPLCSQSGSLVGMKRNSSEGTDNARISSRRKRAHEVRVVKAPHDRYDWMVIYYEAGKRQRKFFKERSDAQTFADLKGNHRTELGRRVEKLTGSQLEDAIETRMMAEKMGFKSAAAALIELQAALDTLRPFGIPLNAAVRSVAAQHEREAESQRVSVVVADMLASKRSLGRSSEYLRDLESRLGRFAVTFGDRLMCSLQPAEIEGWLTGRDLAPASVALERRNLSVLWTFARRRKWVDTNMILANIEPPTVRLGARRIFTVAEMQRVLREAEAIAQETGDHRFVRWLVLGAFAGLRPREADKLTWGHVRMDRERATIKIDEVIAKTGSRRNVPVLPNLRTWLERYGVGSVGPVVGLTAAELRIRRNEVMKLAGIEWSEDVLRHSWCSYRVESSQDAAQAALEAGHSLSIQAKHYKEVVDREDAEKWFALEPVKLVANIVPMNLAKAS